MGLVVVMSESLMEFRSCGSNQNRLTKREKEVLRRISNGETSQEIAAGLYISHHTVLSHRKNLLLKMEARNTAHLVALGYKAGCISS